MHQTLIECDPLTDREIWSAVQKARGRLRRRNQRTGGPTPTWDRLTVAAVVDALRGGHSGTPSVVAPSDLPTLLDGLHDNSVCETDSGVALPVETVRRLACDADIIPVVLDSNSVVLDQGRAKRLATPEQRLAIQTMQTTCSHPDYTITIDDCRIHHTQPWSQGGRTDLDTMAAVCETHHHLIHITPDRVVTWTRPDGQVYWTGPINDRHPIAN